MKHSYIGIFILLLVSISSFGQSSRDHENLIIFDPLFWKDQLKLSDSQSRKIKEINVAYYEELIASYKQKNGQSMKEEIELQLQLRSEKIWSTFDHKQRRRWEKLNQQGLASQSSL